MLSGVESVQVCFQMMEEECFWKLSLCSKQHRTGADTENPVV